jgi:23S rRNA (uracil1939-C5)-methyltransferase
MAKKKYRQSCLSSNKVLDAGAKGVSVAKAPDGKVILSQMSFLAMWLMKRSRNVGILRRKKTVHEFSEHRIEQFVSILVFVVVVNGRMKIQPTVVLNKMRC